MKNTQFATVVNCFNKIKLCLQILNLTLNVTAQYSLQWKYATQGGIYSSPVVDGNAVFIGSNDSCMYSLNAQEGKLNWKFKTSGEVKSKPLVYKESLIF
ncbi:MAG: outer membrane protein assembly factor BamB precursor, partial [Bacteroidetes bacterium]|nr:outer membrane protein assembly factor BamB precursor [Bacteroidota bacterium]